MSVKHSYATPKFVYDIGSGLLKINMVVIGKQLVHTVQTKYRKTS